MSISPSISVGSIDYSPHPSVRNHTIVLENEELLTARPAQIERFVRVWCKDSAQYAPCLNTLTLILRPSWCEDAINTDGIDRLVNYLKYVCLGPLPHMKLVLKLDNYATVSESSLVEFEDTQKVLLEC
jgi:hypothetical protein